LAPGLRMTTNTDRPRYCFGQSIFAPLPNFVTGFSKNPSTPRTVSSVASCTRIFRMTAGRCIYRPYIIPSVLTPALSKLALQSVDGLYSARWVIGLAAEFGVQCRILPRRTVTLHGRGAPAWPRSLWGLVKDPQGWLREYHQRSLVETFWSALKCRSIEKVRKRKPSTQVTEATARAVVHNLRRLCYWHWVERIDPHPDGATVPLREAS
jgi:hypothetical protein